MVRVVGLAGLLQQCGLPTPHAALSGGGSNNYSIYFKGTQTELDGVGLSAMISTNCKQ